MMPMDQEYQTHHVFSELDLYVAFYESLAHSAFQLVTGGTSAIWNIDSYVFSSIQGTLTSIRTILRDGRINDAYALLRKFYDSAIIMIYANLYLEEHYGIENLIVKQIDDWVKGKDCLPKYRVMVEYIRKSLRVDPITQLLFSDSRYARLRERCNDHTHYNSFHNVLLNDPEICLPNRDKALDDFAGDVRDVVILHAAFLFVVKQRYLASSDYIDSLDCGLTPEPGSQYWVAPFVQDLFDEIIVRYRPDVAATIRERICMDLR